MPESCTLSIREHREDTPAPSLGNVSFKISLSWGIIASFSFRRGTIYPKMMNGAYKKYLIQFHIRDPNILCLFSFISNWFYCEPPREYRFLLHKLPAVPKQTFCNSIDIITISVVLHWLIINTKTIVIVPCLKRLKFPRVFNDVFHLSSSKHSARTTNINAESFWFW